MVVEDVVFIQSGRIEVHIAASQIGFPLFQKGLYHMDILINTVGSRLHHIRALDIQLVAVREERIGIVFRDFHDGLVLPTGALEHLVLAGIGIRGQMAHVGDIHDALDVIPGIAQSLLQHILHDVGAQIADVGKVVHRGTAGVHFYLLGMVGDKQFFFMGQGIV